MSTLQPIATAPKDGTWIILFGPSGYVNIRFRCDVAKYDAEFRPRDPWITHSGECFSSSGDPPTHWMPMPTPAESATQPAIGWGVICVDCKHVYQDDLKYKESFPPYYPCHVKRWNGPNLIGPTLVRYVDAPESCDKYEKQDAK